MECLRVIMDTKAYMKYSTKTKIWKIHFLEQPLYCSLYETELRSFPEREANPLQYNPDF